MKELTKQVYQCEHCGAEYESIDDCKSCESQHTESIKVRSMQDIMGVVSVKARRFKIMPKDVFNLVNNGVLLYEDKPFEKHVLYDSILRRMIGRKSNCISDTDFRVSYKDDKIFVEDDGVLQRIDKIGL